MRNKLKISEIKNGNLILEYHDSDLLLEPLYLKVFMIDPRVKYKVASETSIEREILDVVSTDVRDSVNLLKDKNPEDLKFLFSNLSIYKSNELPEYKIDWYAKYINSNNILVNLFKNIFSDEEIASKSQLTLSLEIKGLNLSFVLDGPRISMYSSFNITGPSNNIMKWYMENMNSLISTEYINEFIN